MVHIRQATPADVEAVSSVLAEAAAWLESQGMPLWRAGELTPDIISADIAAGTFFIATMHDEIAGTVKFQLEDPQSWPEASPGEATYLHRFAVRRAHAGGAVASAILDWAVQRTSDLGRSWLRLDCEAARPRLRAMYERYGFRFHSETQVGPYHVARYQYPVLLVKKNCSK